MSSSSSSTTTGSPFKVEHDQKNKMFIIKLGREPAVLQYIERPKGVLDMYHTEVPMSHRGQRIGNVLAEAAFKYASSQDLKMKLTCTFLQKFARENPNDEVTKRLV